MVPLPAVVSDGMDWPTLFWPLLGWLVLEDLTSTYGNPAVPPTTGHESQWQQIIRHGGYSVPGLRSSGLLGRAIVHCSSYSTGLDEGFRSPSWPPADQVEVSINNERRTIEKPDFSIRPSNAHQQDTAAVQAEHHIDPQCQDHIYKCLA